MARHKANKSNAAKDMRSAPSKNPTANDLEQPDHTLSKESSSQLVYEERILQSFHQGPLPDPRTLAMYENICPGVAKQLIDSIQREQERRFENQKEFWIDTKRRRWLSFFMGIVICLVAVWAIYKDFPLTAGGIMALVGILTYLNKDHIKQNLKPVKQNHDIDKPKK